MSGEVDNTLRNPIPTHSPSSSEVTSSCHAFFGNFVLSDCTLLLKLSMALCASDTVELEPDPVEAPPLPTPP